MRRFALLGLVVGTALGTAAPPAAAQEDVYLLRSAPAWLGISYDARWVMAGDQCAPRVVIEAVVHGSPADRAGLRAGDAITAVNGEPVPPGRLQALAARLVPGDSIRLRFLRDGATREVTAVADRRPDRPLTVFMQRSSPSRSMDSPVIEVVGDTLVAGNAAAWDPARTRGYWVRHPDGRSEYRSLRAWSPGELDRRVADLLACADSLHFEAPAGSDERRPSRVSLRALQERADSLRVLMSRRALERADSLRTDSLWVGITRADTLAGVLFRHQETEPTGVWRVQRAADREPRLFPADSGLVRLYRRPDSGTTGTIRIMGPTAGYTISVEDHLAVGLRGVAGAELTPLEPELAEYFRNAEEGLLVLRIAPGTPADRAGLRPGDVIVAAGERRVESVAELRRIIALPTAAAVDLQVVRRGRTRDLTLRRE